MSVKPAMVSVATCICIAVFDVSSTTSCSKVGRYCSMLPPKWIPRIVKSAPFWTYGVVSGTRDRRVVLLSNLSLANGARHVGHHEVVINFHPLRIGLVRFRGNGRGTARQRNCRRESHDHESAPGCRHTCDGNPSVAVPMQVPYVVRERKPGR